MQSRLSARRPYDQVDAVRCIDFKGSKVKFLVFNHHSKSHNIKGNLRCRLITYCMTQLETLSEAGSRLASTCTKNS